MRIKVGLILSIFLIISVLPSCAIRDDTGSSVLLADRYADTYIDDRFENFLKENNIKDYRITEYYRGSEDFEKAFRFKTADNTDQVWGCQIRLNSFNTSGVRAQRMLDFERIEEGVSVGYDLFEKEERKALETPQEYPGLDEDRLASVTLPTAYSWWYTGEYFRDHNDKTFSPENEGLKEYIRQAWIDKYTKDFPNHKDPVAECVVNDDFSVTLKVINDVKKNALYNYQHMLTQYAGWNTDLGYDSIKRVERSEDFRKCTVYVDKEHIDSKMKITDRHFQAETTILSYLIGYQVWKGIMPDDLYAEVILEDDASGEIISRESMTGNIWLEN